MSNEFDSDLQPQRASAFRIHDIILVDRHLPCKIVNMSTSKTGKHGSAKVNFTTLCIRSGKKYQFTCSSSHVLYLIKVKKLKYQVLGINDDILTLINETNTTMDVDTREMDPILSNNLKKKHNVLQDNEEMWVTVWQALGAVTVQEFTIKLEK